MSEAGADKRTTDQTKIGTDNLNPPCFRFLIPTWPPSVNSLYNILFSQRRVELKPEARSWKSRAKEFIPKLNDLPPFFVMHLKMVYQGNWYYKNGSLRRLDVQNFNKLTIDAICEKMSVDDSLIWKKETQKAQNIEKEFIDCELTLISMSCKNSKQ